jgi:branched-chain amino acid transport system permease protein
VVGAALFSVVDELVRPFGQLTVLAYGALLVVLFLLFRQGVVPLVEQLAARGRGSAAEGARLSAPPASKEGVAGGTGR